MAFNWACPHCGTTQTVVKEKFSRSDDRIWVNEQAEGNLVLRTHGVGCSNPNCKKTTVDVILGEAEYRKNTGSYSLKEGGTLYFEQTIYPQGASKPQPDYIPRPLRDDYREACLIRDLSPKASATLVRRCLQGMIREFCGISGPTLYAEINALRTAVDEGKAPNGVSQDSVDAIDAVRGIGNIGAHMEKDINIIVDVDPGEAQALIELVEMLFEEWYVARQKRVERLEKIKGMAEVKKLEIDAQKKIAEQLAIGGSEATDAGT